MCIGVPTHLATRTPTRPPSRAYEAEALARRLGDEIEGLLARELLKGRVARPRGHLELRREAVEDEQRRRGLVDEAVARGGRPVLGAGDWAAASGLEG